MKYVILIYRNPESRQMWESLSDSDRAVGLQAYHELRAEVTASGELIASEALTYPEDGRQVWRRADGSISSDGPYAEVKEHLAGFFLVDCATRERAEEVAAQFAGPGSIAELRPAYVWE